MEAGGPPKLNSVPDDLSPRSRLLFLRRIRRVVGGLEPLVGRGRRSAVRLGEELREEGGQEGPGTGSIRTGHHERIRRHSDLAVSDLLHDLHERDPVGAEHVGLGESTRSRTAIREDLVENDDDRDSVKGDEPVLRPVHASLIQYFENAGSVSVESTLGMLWTFVTTDSRRFSRGSALMRATMSESPVVPMISWISGTFFNSLIVFCVSFERMRRYALLACPSVFFWVQSWSAG